MKLLVIGWDGATWDYLDPLLQAGRLPNLARLLERGSRATLRSTIPPYTNVAWPSLVTGLAPAGTGLFDAARARPGSYDAVPTNLSGHRGIPIWQWVNRYGRRAGVINVPMTYPAGPVEGYLVSGFDSPHESADIAYPPELLADWAAAGHPYNILTTETALMDSQNPHHARGDVNHFVDQWEALTRQQGEMLAWLWQHRPVDLLYAVFSGTDSINHRSNDREHIGSVYEATDAALGEILSVVGDDTLISLVSDHGSTPANRYISLYRVLAEGGWLNFRPQVANRFWRRLPGKAGELAAIGWAKLPGRLRQLISWALLRGDSRLAVANDNIDWARTQVFARSSLGALYVNLQGRYPAGCVSPSEYEALCNTVTEHFLALRDDDNRPLFSRVQRREAVYPGADPADDPPDLILTPFDWRDHMITGYPGDPTVRSILPDRAYGTHTPDGIFLLAGPGIRAGHMLEPADITDVVPTLLAAWNLPVAASVDGRVIDDAFCQPPQLRFEAAEPGEARPVLASEDSTEVLARLRALGYLD